MKQYLKNNQCNILIYIGMALLLFFFFWTTRYAIFGVQEEYGLFYIVQKGDFLSWLNHISRETGRITFYVLSWFWAGPMFISDPVFYKITLCILTTLDVIVFFRLLYVHVDKRFAAFAVALIIIMFQISPQHNLLIAYNYLHIPFLLLMISAHLLLNYCKGFMGYGAVFISALCSLAASFFQENFVLFYIFSFGIMFCYEKKSGFWRKAGSALWKLKFHILGGLIFLSAYFGFRIMFSTGAYEGNSICINQPLTSIEVLVRFITGMIPGRTFKVLSDNVGISGLLAYVGKKDFIIIVFGTIFLCYLLHRSKPFKKSFYLYGSLILCSVLACILHSVSQQYVTWVSMGATYAYVPSYFCYFFIVTMICLIVQNIYSQCKHRGKRICLLVFAIITVAFSTMTVATNNYYNREYHIKYEHYETYRDFFESGGIADFEDSAQVLIIDEYPVEAVDIHQCMTTVRYDAFFFSVTKDINEIDTNRVYYILRYVDDKITAEMVIPD